MATASTSSFRWMCHALPLSFAVACSLDPTPSLGRRAFDPAAVSWPASDSASQMFDAGPPAPNTATTEPALDAAMDDRSVVEPPSPPTLNSTLDSAVAQMPRESAMPPLPDDEDASTDDGAVPTRDAAVVPPCMSGMYVGDFSCTVDPTGVTPFTAMTQASFVLQPSAQGSLILSVQTSNLAFDIIGVFFAGDISGDLDCSMGTFRADIINGVFTPVVLPVALPFIGQITGKLDASGRVLSGSWLFNAPTGDSCTGQWSATLQP